MSLGGARLPTRKHGLYPSTGARRDRPGSDARDGADPVQQNDDGSRVAHAPELGRNCHEVKARAA